MKIVYSCPFNYKCQQIRLRFYKQNSFNRKLLDHNGTSINIFHIKKNKKIIRLILYYFSFREKIKNITLFFFFDEIIKIILSFSRYKIIIDNKFKKYTVCRVFIYT